jgi:hypothetical protein
MKTAEAMNVPLTGRIDIDAGFRRIHPTLPNQDVDEDNMRYKMLRNRMPLDKSAKWLSLVRDFPCAKCGAPPPSDPHHTCGSFGSIKSTDFACIPLCRKCHIEIESNREMHTDAALVYLPLFYAKFMAELYREDGE